MADWKKRVELVFTDAELYRFVAEKATRTDLGVGPYLQLLARAVYLLERHQDATLHSLLGVTSAPAVAAALPPAAQSSQVDNALLDSLLDQFEV